MSPTLPASATAPLLFGWEAPRRRQLALAGFLALSVFGHAICFYVFQIVYPPTVSLLPPPARVSFISPTSEEGKALLQWIESEDPALPFTTSRAPSVEALPKVKHVPSYEGYEPALKSAPPLSVDLSLPSAQPPGPVPAMQPKRSPATAVLPTTVSFSREPELTSPVFPPTKFAASRGEAPDNIRFYVGIGDGGAVRYCFPLNSTGDAVLDEQARRHLLLTRFPARASGKAITAAGSTSEARNLVWSVATIEWGNDLARPEAKAPGTQP